jgi:hypothetical protein
MWGWWLVVAFRGFGCACIWISILQCGGQMERSANGDPPFPVLFPVSRFPFPVSKESGGGSGETADERV